MTIYDKMMQAVQFHEIGGRDVMKLREIPVPSPDRSEVLIKLSACGVNFIDVYHRTGLYPVQLPYVPGLEGAGEVIEAGPDSAGFRKGDRVAYTGSAGAYAQYAVVPAAQLVRLPDNIDDRSAAAVMLQGMTAHYLVHDTYRLRPGHVCLVHAAAGGVGLLLVQMAKKLGVEVVGTVSTDHKARLASNAGCDKVILYDKTDFEAEVREFTRGKGVDVVYDSVGKTTFEKSLNCLRPRGYMVLLGQSSGPVPPIDPAILNKKGSLFLTRPTLFHHIADRKSLENRAGEVLGWVASGELKIRIDSTFGLNDAAEAHRRLENRETAGKLLLIP